MVKKKVKKNKVKQRVNTKGQHYHVGSGNAKQKVFKNMSPYDRDVLQKIRDKEQRRHRLPLKKQLAKPTAKNLAKIKRSASSLTTTKFFDTTKNTSITKKNLEAQPLLKEIQKVKGDHDELSDLLEYELGYGSNKVKLELIKDKLMEIHIDKNNDWDCSPESLISAMGNSEDPRFIKPVFSYAGGFDDWESNQKIPTAIAQISKANPNDSKVAKTILPMMLPYLKAEYEEEGILSAVQSLDSQLNVIKTNDILPALKEANKRGDLPLSAGYIQKMIGVLELRERFKEQDKKKK